MDGRGSLAFTLHLLLSFTSFQFLRSDSVQNWDETSFHPTVEYTTQLMMPSVKGNVAEVRILIQLLVQSIRCDERKGDA